MLVFQDLALRPGTQARGEIRAALLASTELPWRHDTAKEGEIVRLAGEGEDIIVFVRTPGDGIAAASLFLWAKGGDYEVTNIVPLETSNLGEGGYNAVLSDFVAKVARPAAGRSDFRIETTAAEQTINDWLPNTAAVALRRFSATANKATGSSHPSDRKRWYAFLIAANGAGPTLTPEILERWLVEDGWTEDGAERLAMEYEFGLALLVAYDHVGR